jgi:SNF2 family DNA or RNA helicase
LGDRTQEILPSLESSLLLRIGETAEGASYGVDQGMSLRRFEYHLVGHFSLYIVYQTNWYHVVITSYQLVVQDAFAFKRKKWYYMILDEAQNIKNFQSQRWQTLINFNTQRRLLLTGTPLQNSLMELWSLLHFLMPYIFRSRKEFSYWFSNPMNSMIEGNTDRNDGIITKLHGIIRPFVLRRLKKDVETQMPGKFEHVVKCQLSRRQVSAMIGRV